MMENADDTPLNLNTIQVASPCKADWDDMTGTDAIRFCGLCAMNVYNLSAMTTDEATSLVELHSNPDAGRLCVRFFRRADGTLLTQDCPVGLQKIREKKIKWRVFKTVATITLITVAGTFAAHGFAASQESPKLVPDVKGQLRIEPVMGKPVASPQPTTQPTSQPATQPSPTIAPGGCVLKEPKQPPKTENKNVPGSQGEMGDMVVPPKGKKSMDSRTQVTPNKVVTPPSRQVMGEMMAPPPPKTQPAQKSKKEPAPPMMGAIKPPPSN